MSKSITMIRHRAKTYRKQAGFALLEVLLAVIVIALAAWGVIEVFNSSKTKNAVTKSIDNLGKISAAYAQVGNPSSSTTVTDLYATGNLTGDMVTGSPSAYVLHFPLGSSATFTGVTTSAYEIQLVGLDAAPAQQIALSQFTSADVYALQGTTAPTPTQSPNTQAEIMTNTTPTGTAPAVFSITFCYPKGSVCNASK